MEPSTPAYAVAIAVAVQCCKTHKYFSVFNIFFGNCSKFALSYGCSRKLNLNKLLETKQNTHSLTHGKCVSEWETASGEGEESGRGGGRGKVHGKNKEAAPINRSRVYRGRQKLLCAFFKRNLQQAMQNFLQFSSSSTVNAGRERVWQGGRCCEYWIAGNWQLPLSLPLSVSLSCWQILHVWRIKTHKLPAGPGRAGASLLTAFKLIYCLYILTPPPATRCPLPHHNNKRDYIHIFVALSLCLSPSPSLAALPAQHDKWLQIVFLFAANALTTKCRNSVREREGERERGADIEEPERGGGVYFLSTFFIIYLFGTSCKQNKKIAWTESRSQGRQSDSETERRYMEVIRYA